MGDYRPTKADRFSFGLWTVGWQARDPFGDPTRPPLDPIEAVHRLSDLGAYGLTFHDDDLVPFGSSAADRDAQIKRFRAALDETGMVGRWSPPTCSAHPVFKDGGFTSNDRECAATRCARSCATWTSPPSSAPTRTSSGGGREGSEFDAQQGRPLGARPLPRGRSTCSRSTPSTAGTSLRFALEPKPNEPRGDILLPTVGHALAFISTLEHQEMVGAEPRGRARADGRPELRPRRRPGAVAGQALPHRPQRPARHQVRPGLRLRPRRPDQRVLPRRPAGERPGGAAYDGPRHFDYKPARTEDIGGVWDSGRGQHGARTCCCASGPAPSAPTPRCRRRWPSPAWPSSAAPTLDDGETYEDLLADRTAWLLGVGERGMCYVRLDQLAIEHLLGAR